MSDVRRFDHIERVVRDSRRKLDDIESTVLARLGSHTHSGGPVMSRVASDITVTASTTLVNATGLSASLDASSFYGLEMFLIYQSGATPDIDFGWMSPPSGIGGLWSVISSAASAAYTAELGLNGTGADVAVALRGDISTSSAGTLQFGFAQRTSDPGSTILRAGSWMQLTKIG